VRTDLNPESPGLTKRKAAALLVSHGANELPENRPEPWWKRVWRQLSSPIIYILLFALAFDVVVWVMEDASGWPFESIAIVIILAFNTIMGVWQEYRAEDALAHLKRLSAPNAWVRRDGKLELVPASQLVPGDLVRIEAGNRVFADGTLIGDAGLMIDESMLTGESVPVERDEGEDLFAGTLAVRGLSWMRVTKTGPLSAMGRIASLLTSVAVEPTPLENRLARFGHVIARWVAAIAVVLMVVGVGIEGIGHFNEALLFAVAVAVAAVPEGLPAVLTLTLALGTTRMASRKAVVRRLAAVETLGSVTVIATDKTGTLTENTMVVQGLDSPNLNQALNAMVLASEAETEGASGDPLEIGLYEYVKTQGIDPAAVRKQYPRQSVQPFDSALRYMQATVLEDGQPVTYLKGAAEVLLGRSRLGNDEQADWQRKIEEAATLGFRVLGLARASGEADGDIEWLGIVSLWDPPRPEVADAIKASQGAGIRIMMITGDHPSTALAIANSIGISTDTVMTGDQLDQLNKKEIGEKARDVSVFARVSPEHKLALVDALKANGETVAMTGDGINDAPALKRADVGVAMGQRGSDVSREVADLVLLDDNFATIAAAVEEGRGIYANILKFIRFLFSTNVALVMLIAFGVAGAAMFNLHDESGGLLVPLIAVQLLWINIIADGPPALALGIDRNPGMMTQRPRSPSSPLLSRIDVQFILFAGILKGGIGIFLFFLLPTMGYSGSGTQTSLFLFESLAQLAFVYPSRRIMASTISNHVLNVIIVASVILQILTITVPGLRTMLGLVPIDGFSLGIVGISLLVTIVGAEVWSRHSNFSTVTQAGNG
jgi:Ca2+-transporting ATPase